MMDESILALDEMVDQLVVAHAAGTSLDFIRHTLLQQDMSEEEVVSILEIIALEAASFSGDLS